MTNPTFRDLRKMKREIESLFAISEREHLGSARHARLTSLISQYRTLRNQLEKRKQSLEDAELDAIRASKRTQSADQREKHLQEVHRIRRERRKLLGEI